MLLDGESSRAPRASSLATGDTTPSLRLRFARFPRSLRPPCPRATTGSTHRRRHDSEPASPERHHSMASDGETPIPPAGGWPDARYPRGPGPRGYRVRSCCSRSGVLTGRGVLEAVLQRELHAVIGRRVVGVVGLERRIDGKDALAIPALPLRHICVIQCVSIHPYKHFALWATQPHTHGAKNRESASANALALSLLKERRELQPRTCTSTAAASRSSSSRSAC